ncbi:MAG: hypothetical protein E7642_03930 [Ruminococcaceae bacterium]|nr:hypothetical protein [Oscillospiraceae bacterium]
MNDINANALGYVVVTDYIEANTGKDVSSEIQKIIDENPMRTIYFPDGEYILAKPICTSGKPETAVSLHLSNFATLKASDDWSDTEAMVRLGAAEPYNTIYRNGSNYYFYGGIVDGNGVANGISIDSGRETSIRNVSIKHTQIGIHIKRGANNGSSDADIETVNIVGNNKKDSVGVLIEGYDNTLTNMRIAAVQVGLKVRSGGNCMRNIHPLFIYGYEYAEDNIDFAESIAFSEETSGTNWYDYCYSDQMATGYKLCPGSKAVISNAFIMWYSPRGDKEVGFEIQGDFNASITNPKIHFRGDTTNNEVLVLPEDAKGQGFLDNPILNDEVVKDKTYKKFVTGRIIW